MVWFQCEDCGENLKKPKLSNHFRICSAAKLSCIDCGQMFGQQSVQGHTQCITEAEKYGPKDQVKYPNGAQTKPNKAKPGSDVDITVGLSSHAPWSCSLCNTQTTSRQTLLQHADGKKHRAKARAFHAAQKQSCQAEESTPNKILGDRTPITEPVEANDITNLDEMKEKDHPMAAPSLTSEEGKENLLRKKRKHNEASGGGGKNEVINGSDLMIQDGTEVQQLGRPKKKKCFDVDSQNKDHGEKNGQAKESSHQKLNWKKLVVSILKLNPDGALKVRKLQKLVVKALQESGLNEDEAHLRNKLTDKISTSSRFVIDKKYIRLAAKEEN